MQVLWVMPGTPAARAGLAAGDVVLEVGGVPASTLESDAFIGLMTGPEGSEVDFLVGFESEEGFVEEEVTVIRQFLDG
jgi:C-terminal processing protease CtpA/Prc